MISRLILSLPLLFMNVDLALAAPNESVAKAYEKTADLNDASFVTEIIFNKDSSELSADGKSALRDIMKAAQEKGKIESVRILAWSDHDYPNKKKQLALSKNERKLADERALEIKGFVEDNSKGVSIITHNMAEQPYTLQNLFKSGDRRVKKSLKTAGMPSKSGRALVMITVQ
jgi:outer membrane protein OmpA-like peptidoglycan-associated protein